MKKLSVVKKRMKVTRITYSREGELDVMVVSGEVKNIGDVYAFVHSKLGDAQFILEGVESGSAICTLSLEKFLEKADICFADEWDEYEETEE